MAKEEQALLDAVTKADIPEMHDDNKAFLASFILGELRQRGYVIIFAPNVAEAQG